MPEVPLNYWAILVSVAVSFVLGSLWYGPLFGKQWMHMMGFKKENMTEAQKKGMIKSYVIMMIGSFVMVYVLAHSIVFASAYLGVTGVSAGLQGGMWNWLGFVAPATVGMVLWEGKPWKLWFIVAGYQLVYMLIAGVILAVWK